MRIIGILFLLTGSIAIADLGNSESKCADEYGEPTRDLPVLYNEADVIHVYEFDDMTLSISFRSGRAVKIYYQAKSHKKFSADKVQQLLDKNAEGFSWKKTDESSGTIFWDRGDGVVATLIKDPSSLLVMKNP